MLFDFLIKFRKKDQGNSSFTAIYLASRKPARKDKQYMPKK